MVDILNRVLVCLQTRFKSGLISSLEYRDSYLFISKHLQKFSVDGVAAHLTQEEAVYIKKMQEIKAAMARGENLMAKKDDVSRPLNLGTSSNFERVARDNRKANSIKWSKANCDAEVKKPTKGTKVHLDDLYFSGVRSGPAKPSPGADPLPFTGDELRCSFCDKPVGHKEATHGKTSKISVLKEVVSGPPVDLIEHLRISTKEVVACPNCSLKVPSKGQRWISPENC